MRAVLLSGEHPTLPAAELRALLDVEAPGAAVRVAGRIARIDGPGGDAAARMALAREWMEPWGEDEDTPEGHARLAGLVGEHAAGFAVAGAAVVGLRTGVGKSPHRGAVERLFGSALRDAGHRIDLLAPQLVVAAWHVEGRLHVGRRVGCIDRGAFEARRGEARAHFSPVSLHPRRARALVHLARVPPGGRLHDPFCGTGTIVLEAALDGLDASGSDADPLMVQGTLQALADDGPQAADGAAFVADVGDAAALVGPVDGVVTDLPYGRASTTGGEAPPDLHRRALRAIHDLLRPGGHAVVGAPYDVSGLAAAAGLAPVEVHTERVHRSLTRAFAVVKRPAGVGAA